MTGEIKSFNPSTKRPNISNVRRENREMAEAVLVLGAAVIFLVAMLANMGCTR